MKVKDALQMLSRYSPDDEIIIMWWDYELVNSWESLTTDEWSDVVDELDEMEPESERVAEAIVDTVYAIVNANKTQNDGRTE